MLAIEQIGCPTVRARRGANSFHAKAQITQREDLISCRRGCRSIMTTVLVDGLSSQAGSARDSLPGRGTH
jgi:hypothetical protein